MTKSFGRQLLAAVDAVPVGEKLPVSALARGLNCTNAVVIAELTRMVGDGTIDRATMRSPTKCIPLAAAAVDSCGGAARVGDPLLAEVEGFLASSGMAPTTFGNKAGLGLSFVANLRKAKRGPNERTLAKARAFMAARDKQDFTIDRTPPESDAGEGGAAPVPGAANEAGAAVARCSPVAPADVAERPSGAVLAARIRRAIAANGMTQRQFLAPIAGDAHNWLLQLETSIRPLAATVERVEALLAGRPVPAGPVRAKSGGARPRVERDEMGLPESGRARRDARTIALQGQRRDEVARCAAVSEAARAARMPGETLAAAVKREAEEQGERRRMVRETKGVRAPEASEVDLASTIARHPRARAVPGLSAERWNDLRDLAGDLGDTPVGVLDRVIEAGIDQLRRIEARP